MMLKEHGIARFLGWE